jgi:hypothetical protein
MRKQSLLLVLTGILLFSLGLAAVGADITVSEGYVKPDDSVDLVFSGPPGSSFTVTVSNSRGVLDSATLVFDDFGEYTWKYTVNGTANTDKFYVRAIIDGKTAEARFIVSVMEPRQLAETFRLMATNARKQAEAAIIEAKRADNLTPDTIELFREALQLLQNAKEYSEEGDHAAALETIKEVLGMFETVIDDTYNTDLAPPEQSENQRRLVRAKGALLDLSRRLEELKHTSQSLERNGFSVEKLNEHIHRLADGLEKAREAIKSNNLDAAERHLRGIDEVLNNIMNNIRQRIQENNRRKASLYQTTLVNRYNTMMNTLTVMKSVDSERVTSVLTAINSIEDKLDEARRLYEEGRTTESVSVLFSADREFKQAFSGIKGDETKILLNSIDRLTVKLENTLSLRERMQIQMEIEAAKTELKNRLEQNTITPTQPPPSDTTDQNATSLTP